MQLARLFDFLSLSLFFYFLKKKHRGGEQLDRRRASCSKLASGGAGLVCF